MLKEFMGLDEAQRMQTIQFAAMAVTTGPVVLAFSSAIKGIGTVSSSIGKFAGAVSKAGSGWKGIMAVITKSPPSGSP